ncbi:unnamed protein product, partial [Brassica oleracea]
RVRWFLKTNKAANTKSKELSAELRRKWCCFENLWVGYRWLTVLMGFRTVCEVKVVL